MEHDGTRWNTMEYDKIPPRPPVLICTNDKIPARLSVPICTNTTPLSATEQVCGSHRQNKTSSGYHRLHKEAVVTAVLTEKRLPPLSATELCCVVLCFCLEYHVQEDTQRLSHAQSLENACGCAAPTQLASKTPNRHRCMPLATTLTSASLSFEASKFHFPPS